MNRQNLYEFYGWYNFWVQKRLTFADFEPAALVNTITIQHISHQGIFVSKLMDKWTDKTCMFKFDWRDSFQNKQKSWAFVGFEPGLLAHTIEIQYITH